MAMTSVVFDERSTKTMENLKQVFGVSTNAAVIRKALALAQVISQQADDDHTVLLFGKDQPIKVNLVG